MRRAVIVAATAAALAAFLLPADATWKPEYADTPPAVREWFDSRELTPEARLIYMYVSCCRNADRFRTKFVASGNKDEWWYYTDPACTDPGCRLALIPSIVIHDDLIPHSDDPKAEAAFNQARAEGVLFVVSGKPVCFWPPEGGI